MIELTYNGTSQTVAANGRVPFNTVHQSCECYEKWRPGSSSIILKKPGRYLISASANIAAVDTAGGAVSLAVAIGGEVIDSTIMTITPGAGGQFFNVSAPVYVDVYPGCCERISLVNPGDAALVVDNQNLIAIREGGVCHV